MIFIRHNSQLLLSLNKERAIMRILLLCLCLGVFLFGMTGCENLYKNTRQTGKNINNLALEGYDGDIYASN
jgi:hypothetical protein